MKRGIPQGLNLLLALVFAAIGLGSLFLLPLFLLPLDTAWGWLLVVPVILTITNWALIHEGIHGALHPNRTINDGGSRLLAILFGGSFQVLRFGHLFHHMYNRTPLDRTEVFDPARHHRPLFTVGYYLRLNAGLYLLEFLLSLALLLPRRLLDGVLTRLLPGDTPDSRKARQFARHRLLSSAALRTNRLDALVLLVVFGLAFDLYGENAYMLALMLLGRGFMVSVVDNSFHYGTPLEDLRHARNLRLPAPLERFILNFNLHRVHHHQAGLSWAALPDAFMRQGDDYDAGFAAAVARQYRGPIPLSRLERI